MQRSGAASLLALLCLLLSGCLYSLSGGGGLPRHVRTVAVIPFENETANPELAGELHTELRKGMLERLRLREATEQRANAVVRGRITRYEPDVPVAFSADPSRATSARRRLQMTVDVQIIDQTTGRTLFERNGVNAEGEYAEREEPAGRRQALQRIVNEIVEGAQSQW
jgi:outer membrane lipopolysaccharide assembly protein LptE/RlpB